MNTVQKSSKIDHKIFFVLVFIKKWKIFWKKIKKKISEKSFSKKIFFRLEKHSQVVSALKAKNIFLRLTDQPFSVIFWLAPVDREMFSGHLGVFIKKICWGKTFILIEKGEKRPRVDAWDLMG